MVLQLRYGQPAEKKSLRMPDRGLRRNKIKTIKADPNDRHYAKNNQEDPAFTVHLLIGPRADIVCNETWESGLRFVPYATEESAYLDSRSEAIYCSPMPLSNASFSAEFRDLDAYIASLTGADFRYTITRPDVSLWKLDRVFLPGGLVVQSIWGGCGAILESGTPDFSINLFLHREGYFQVLGHELDFATAVLMPPGSESFSRTPGKYGCFAISIPRRFVRTSSALSALDDDNIRKARVIRARSAKRDSVRPLLVRFFSNVAMNPEILASPALLTGFRDELVMVLGREYGGQSESPPPRRGRISKVDAIAVSRAVEAIEAFDGASMPINDLTSVVGIPERTLRAGFNKYLGLSPRKYMLLRTVHRARSRLAVGSSEDTTVARIAMDLGFWDLGRFAMRYRALFGEPPSATLHRT